MSGTVIDPVESRINHNYSLFSGLHCILIAVEMELSRKEFEGSKFSSIFIGEFVFDN